MMLYLQPFYRLQQKLGNVGLLGLLGFLLALALVLGQVLPAQQNLQELAAHLEQLHSQPQAVQAPIAQADSDAASLQAFYQQFAGIKDLPATLQTISDIAQQQKLKLDKADFKLAREQQGRLMRYEITLPVQSSYPQVRRFVDSLSQQIPTMGLSEINLKREASKDQALEAKLTFILYLQESN